MQYSWADKLSNVGTKVRTQFLKNFQTKVVVPTNPLVDMEKWSINRAIHRLVNLIKVPNYTSVWMQILHSVVALLVIVMVVMMLRISMTVFGIIWSIIRQTLRRRWEIRFGSVWFCPVDFYRKTLLWLQARGINRTRTETAGEFADRIGRIFPDIDGDLKYMTDVYLEVRFGKKAITPQQRERAVLAATRIQTVLTEREKGKSRSGKSRA